MSSSAKRPPNNHDCQLFVEGRDDVMTIGTLLAQHQIQWPSQPWHPYIHNAEGIEKLLPRIPLILKAQCRRLGFVVDADLSLPARWEQLRGRFKSAGITLPAAPSPSGTILTAPHVNNLERIGVWLMPDNQQPGMLEDFVTTLVPAGDPTFAVAVKSTKSAMKTGAPLLQSHRSKGEIHAYLAWQNPSGIPFGTALTAQVLQHDAPVAKLFVRWLRDLFEAPA